MKCLLLIATAVFVLSFGVVYAASPSTPLTVTVTPSQSSGGGDGGLPGSILPPCPGGCTWRLGFDDEFSGNGSPGNLATDGINWNVWSHSLEGVQMSSYPATTISNCTNMAFESGGYLHIIPIGSYGVYGSSASNPAYGCEIDYPNATPGYWEARTDYDNAAGWASADWICCGGSNNSLQLEVDVFELDGPVQLVTIYWDSYGAEQRLYTAPSYLSGWHTVGIDWEANSGYYFYIDGTQVGSLNPTGCAAATPCNVASIQRNSNAVTQPASDNSTGMLIDWVRYYTHS